MSEKYTVQMNITTPDGLSLIYESRVREGQDSTVANIMKEAVLQADEGIRKMRRKRELEAVIQEQPPE